jgi:hypothetical protein
VKPSSVLTTISEWHTATASSPSTVTRGGPTTCAQPPSIHRWWAEDSTIFRIIPRAIRIEDPHDAHVDAVHAVVIHEQRFSDPFALVVTRSPADRIDAAAVALRLRVDFGDFPAPVAGAVDPEAHLGGVLGRP